MMSELQNRLVTRVFAGRHQLPSRSVMKEWMDTQSQYYKAKLTENLWYLPFSFSFELLQYVYVLNREMCMLQIFNF